MTSLWAFFRNHQAQLFLIPLGLIIFVAGWQTSRITSPYYAAHPIIFEDRQCDSCSSSGGSRGELEALQTEGTKPKQAPPIPAVAGTIQGKFVGSVNSDLYHDPTCSSANRIKEENQVWFSSVEDALAAGYSPSKCTQEKGL